MKHGNNFTQNNVAETSMEDVKREWITHTAFAIPDSPTRKNAGEDTIVGERLRKPPLRSAMHYGDGQKKTRGRQDTVSLVFKLSVVSATRQIKPASFMLRSKLILTVLNHRFSFDRASSTFAVKKSLSFVLRETPTVFRERFRRAVESDTSLVKRWRLSFGEKPKQFCEWQKELENCRE